MALAAEDIQFIKEHLGEWLAERSLGKPPAVYEIELREWTIRIEEELKHQRELIKAILEQMDKRFDLMQQQTDNRFEVMQQQQDLRFGTIEARFESIDRQFEAVATRFDLVDRRLDELSRRVDRFMFWSFGLAVSVGALIIAAVKLWP